MKTLYEKTCGFPKMNFEKNRIDDDHLINIKHDGRLQDILC